MNVPLLVMPPRKVIGELIELVQVPVELIVVNPLNIFVPAVAETVNVEAFATVVVPLTVNENPAAVKPAALIPSPKSKLPIVNPLTTVAVEAVPLNVRLVIAVVPVDKVFKPEPERPRLL